MGLNIPRITRTNLVREREELTAAPNLEVFQNRGLPLDLRSYETRPGIFLTWKRHLRLRTMTGSNTSMFGPGVATTFRNTPPVTKQNCDIGLTQAVKNRGAQHHLQTDEDNRHIRHRNDLHATTGQMHFDTAAT